MSAHFLKLGKLTKGAGHVHSAARHNLREIQAELGAREHIDAGRSALNVVLAGEASAAGVSKYAKQLMADAGVIKLRKDCVRAVERSAGRRNAQRRVVARGFAGLRGSAQRPRGNSPVNW